MKITHWSESLLDLDACGEAVAWARTQPTAAKAWEACKRGDWMLWLIGEVAAGEPWSDERKPMVMAACECARLSLHLVPAGDERPRIAIETSEAWCRGEATPKQVHAAACAADAAATLILAESVLAEAEGSKAPAAEIAKLRAAIESGDWLDQDEATDDLRYSLGHYCSECGEVLDEPGSGYCSRDCWRAGDGGY